MLRFAPATAAIALLCGSAFAAPDPDRDFSGEWVLDAASSSNVHAISFAEDRYLTVIQDDNAVQIRGMGTGGAVVRWSYALDRSETRYQIGAENRSSETKWESDALLVNTLVTSPQNYSVMDRWKLSRDHRVLTVTRQIVRASGEIEGTLVYRRPVAPEVSGLGRHPGPAAPSEITVVAGTRIPMTLRNPIDTKHSHEGDRVYLETAFPVTVDGRIVIPRGSFVNGTVTTAKAAGVVKGKGELFIRFDSLTLPNGVTRDFRSRIASADTVDGKLDRKEGTITGERDKGKIAKTTAEGAGIGGGAGGIAGAAAGHPLPGVGVGAAAGAAAGLASVLIKHRPDAALPAGTTVEMILDRDLRYSPSELKF
ncbi:MAG TPA: TrbI/VirB10 family protein [Bryobacteraceae bacterium]|nr:TrbI/VirB10 family protein [Bryobacteraceae bacterium]